jgi:hypothetical protein
MTTFLEPNEVTLSPTEIKMTILKSNESDGSNTGPVTTPSVELDSYHGEGMKTSEDSSETDTVAVKPEPVEQRLDPRVSRRVKAVVQVREDDGNAWKEIIEITTISKNGAALLLSNECPVGRMVSLAIQMPVELRVYDHYQDIYAMLGVVQNCSPVIINERTVYHIGVAFIGKKIPDSFKADPSQAYRIVGMSPSGLWTVTEAAQSFVNRASARFWKRFEVAISLRDEASRSTKRITAVTRDVSLGGMSLWGPLDAKVGDRVKINSHEHDFFGMAVVRNRTESSDAASSMVHLQFDGTQFPIARIREEPAPAAAAEVTEKAA